MEEAEFSLTQLQNWMLGMLVRHAPHVGGKNPNRTNVANVVQATKRLSATRHLDIYRQSYVARLRACMEQQFSALRYALGNQLFESFADQYLDVYPSESYAVNKLGERFEDFLEQLRPDAGLELNETWPDFIIELAGFEYGLSEMFDEKGIEEKRIPQDDTPDELLKIVPVLGLFNHRFPTSKYYLEFSQGKNPELPLPKKSFCAVVRRDYKLRIFTISEAQYYFLNSLKLGRSVEQAKDNLVKKLDFDIIELESAWPEWRRYFTASGFLFTGARAFSNNSHPKNS
jgi:hypothetical protein